MCVSFRVYRHTTSLNAASSPLILLTYTNNHLPNTVVRTDHILIILAPMRQHAAMHATNIPRKTEPAANIS